MKNVIHCGSVKIPIYRSVVRRGGKEWESWVVCYSINGVRHRITRSDYAEAKQVAEEVASKIDGGRSLAAGMAVEDVASWARATQLLPPGRTLELVVAEYAQAISRLPFGASLATVVDFYLSKHAPLMERTVTETIAEMVAQKKQDGASRYWVKQLTNILARFARSNDGSISALTGQQLDAWLRTTYPGAKSRNGARICLQALFSFARKNNYLPRDWHEMEAVAVAKLPPTPIEVYTPDEFRALLRASSARLLPLLLFGGLAGLRTAEIERLDWSDVRSDHVVVTAQNAKTKTRRVVPLCPSLRAAIRKLRKPSGKLYHSDELGRDVSSWAVRKGLKWKRNALRHSFISYRLAQTKDAAQTALEAGHTTTMMFAHYRELVTEQAAAEWFRVRIPSEQIARKS